MKPQTNVLINREATKHDVDKWMEDLFARIETPVRVTRCSAGGPPHSIVVINDYAHLPRTATLRFGALVQAS